MMGEHSEQGGDRAAWWRGATFVLAVALTATLVMLWHRREAPGGGHVNLPDNATVTTTPAAGDTKAPEPPPARSAAERDIAPVREGPLNQALVEAIVAWSLRHPERYAMPIRMLRAAAEELNDPELVALAKTELDRLERLRSVAALNALDSARRGADQFARDGDYDSAIAQFDNIPDQFTEVLGDQAAKAKDALDKEARSKVLAVMIIARNHTRSEAFDEALAALDRMGIVFTPMLGELQTLRDAILTGRREAEERRRIAEQQAAEQRVWELLNRVDEAVAKGELADIERLLKPALEDATLRPADALLKVVAVVCRLLPAVSAKPPETVPANADEAMAAAMLACAAKDADRLALALGRAKDHLLHGRYHARLMLLKHGVNLDGLILRYAFDRDEKDQVTDASPSNHHGKAVELGWTKDGKRGGAAVFNGQSSYVDLGADHTLPTLDNYTISVWFLNDGKGKWDGYGQKILDKTIWYSDFYLCLAANSGKLIFVTFQNHVRGDMADEKGRDFRDGKWHHCVIVKQRAEGRMYVDGEQVGHGKTIQQVKNNGPLLLGASLAEDMLQRRHWSGRLDEVMVFNRALPSDEVKALWAYGSQAAAQ